MAICHVYLHSLFLYKTQWIVSFQLCSAFAPAAFRITIKAAATQQWRLYIYDQSSRCLRVI